MMKIVAEIYKTNSNQFDFSNIFMSKTEAHRQLLNIFSIYGNIIISGFLLTKNVFVTLKLHGNHGMHSLCRKINHVVFSSRNIHIFNKQETKPL